MPDMLSQLFVHEGRTVYNILFRAAWSVLETSAHTHPKWLGARPGMITLL
jgi:hypothetical protein